MMIDRITDHRIGILCECCKLGCVILGCRIWDIIMISGYVLDLEM